MSEPLDLSAATQELRMFALEKALGTAAMFANPDTHRVMLFDIVVDGAQKYYQFLIRGKASLSQREKGVAMETIASLYPKATDEEIYEIYAANKVAVEIGKGIERANR